MCGRRAFVVEAAPHTLTYLFTQHRSRSSLFVIDEQAVADAVSFTLKEDELPTPKPTPPPPPPLLVVPSVEELAVSPPPTSTTTAAPPDPSAPAFDLPVAALAVPLLAVFAAATFFMRERVNEETPLSPTPTPEAVPGPAPAPAITSNVVDLSIPYDAAAKLAYDKSDKSMTYDAFKKKFEADAVADVIAKKKAKVNA